MGEDLLGGGEGADEGRLLGNVVQDVGGLGSGSGADDGGLGNLVDGLGGGGGTEDGGLGHVVESVDGLGSGSGAHNSGGGGSSTDNSRLGNAVHKSLRGSSGAHNSGGRGSMDDVSSSRLGAGSNHSLGRGSGDDVLGLLRGIEGDGNRSGLAIVGHGSLEAVHSISGVLNHTDTAIGVSNRVGSPDNISLTGLLPGLGVTGAGIGNRVAKVVAGIGMDDLLFLDDMMGNSDGSGTKNSVLDRVGNGLDGLGQANHRGGGGVGQDGAGVAPHHGGGGGGVNHMGGGGGRHGAHQLLGVLGGGGGGREAQCHRKDLSK